MVTNKYFLTKNLAQQGFGLVELMVSISIMVLVTSIILVKHDTFNGATLLRGQAYKIALQIREIQLLSISTTEYGNGFRNVYGLYFDTVNNNDNYPIFRDNDDDYYYDTDEKFGKQGILDKRFAIDEIRLIGGGGSTVNNLAITFERPNFDAILYKDSGVVDSAVSGVEIDIRLRGTAGSGPGEVRTIEVTRTGQITVK